MNKINCFIVGAQKCGTTSLKNYLGEHPGISAQVQTEMTFFVNDNEYNLGIENIFNKYFEQKESANILVAKDVALSSDDKGLQRLREHNPDCKIIYMIREPIKRAYSSYLMDHREGSEDRDFDSVVNDSLSNQNTWQYRAFIKLGCYIDFIRKLQKYFPQNNIKIIILEEFEKNPNMIIAELFDWLGVEKTYLPQLDKIHNKGAKAKSKVLAKITHWFLNENNILKKIIKKVISPQIAAKLGEQLRNWNKSKSNLQLDMSPKTKEILSDFYETYNRQLAQYLNLEYPIWKI
jgi:hypothetical protein